jgi:RimJ/RimL family protein N-acetyltransferase
MKLINVCKSPEAASMLYELLKEREPHQSISHKQMPTWQQHVKFFNSYPYEAWYAISEDDTLKGAVYLSQQREIGIGVLKQFRGCGLAQLAIKELMRTHPGKFLANINPANEASANMFTKLGFKLLQVTYEHE